MAKSVVKFVHEKVDEFDKWTGSAQWRREAREAYELEAGRQWPEEDLRTLKDQKRPAVVFNEFLRFVDAVVGFEIKNKMDHKYIPVGLTDSGAVETVNKVIKTSTDELAPGATTRAFRDAVLCGMGWTDTKMDYDNDFEGRICEDRLDPLDMGWDFSATKPDLSDGKYRFHFIRLTVDQFKDRWPEKVEEVQMAMEIRTDGDGENITTGRTEDRRYHFDDSPGDDDRAKFPVIRCQWTETITVHVLAMPDGQKEEVDGKTLAKLKKQFERYGMTVTTAKKRKKVYYQAYVCGDVEIEGKTEIPFWTLLPMTGKFDRNRGYWFGMARVARDPQMWGNKFFSNIMHIISSAGKGLLLEKDAVGPLDQQAFQNDWARPDKVKFLEPGAISGKKYAQPDQAGLPHGLTDLMTFAFSSIQNTLGVSSEFLGMSGRTQAVGVEDSRSAASVAVLAEFFDSRRFHIMRTGRLKLAYAAKYIPDSVYYRIAQEDGVDIAPHLQQIRDVDFLSADVKVDEVSMSSDQRASVFRTFMEIMPVLQGYQIPPQVLLAVLRYSPLPTSLLDQLQKMVDTPPDPDAEKAKQLDFQEKVTDIKETESKTALNMAKAQSEGQGDVGNFLMAMANQQNTRLSMDADAQKHGQSTALNNQRFVQDMTKMRSQQEKQD